MDISAASKMASEKHDQLLLFPKMNIGQFPTPIKKIQVDESRHFWMKDDGVSSGLYGGNKVRKLEYLLADLKKRQIRRVVVYGDTDSHNVLATSIFCKQLGFEVDAIVFDCQRDLGGDAILSSMKRIKVHRAKNMVSAMLKAYLFALRLRTYLIPLGCTSALSNIGYVDAAFELYQQFDQIGLGFPEKIYIPFGSGGTVAGLLIGFSLLKIPVKIVGVQTVDRIVANEKTLWKTIRKTLELMGIPGEHAVRQAMNCLDRIDCRYLGRGYKDIPEAVDDAVQFMTKHHVELEPVFSGKAMAALVNDMKSFPPERMMFWNTHSQVHLEKIPTTA